MSLDAAARRRYARQLLLGEIDEGGQARLLEARFRRPPDCDSDAFGAAADYLERAGCSLTDDGDPLVVADVASVLQFAGSPSLRAPAAAVMGAFAAVEHIKGTLGLGEPRPFPAGLRLRTKT